ncbi:hypothetical protein CDL15_Pgr020148 [Punica granatum]|uniref:Uncharacterized protein n=1 Tax=Punica granatum TaxID=22663 RepID=A0A218VQP4_PUNGR|nr:hypothetical protein CDL15_Pgr020148 [Punica granatum]PKI48192.1 hypothetical protein CRG98_031457 [Punica granatum]
MRLDWEAIFSSTLRRPFHVLTITLLSLLLPLSFLLLARLSYANFSSSLYSYQPPQVTFPLSLFFHPRNPNPIHAAVTFISLSTLLHGLTGRNSILAESPASGVQSSKLYLAWALLCMLQVSVGLGVEGSIASGIGGFPSLDPGRSLMSRMFFFLGLHGTMMHWCSAVVRPVVDDTVYGAPEGQQWPEKLAVAAAYGALWWCTLRDEVEAMVIVPQVKKELLMGVGMVDFVGWWLYYLVVTIGMVRVVKGMMWAATLLLCWRVRHKFGASNDEQDMV